ncbi:MAG: non-homologous end-joining DNA ligase [Desulfohalobiaceae bacterium]|nr:non-homologous end-joining DNA ligase [Desulfohalobiaceae bacterium]
MPSEPRDWAFEYKWDGIRALCYWQSGEMRLESRSLREITWRYPDLRARPGDLPEDQAIFDGEIMAFERDGRPSFSRLQQRMHLSPEKAARMAGEVPVKYYVFDLLWLKERSLVDEPYRIRRERLEGLAVDHERWRVPASHLGQGSAMLRVAAKWGLEGIMAKQAESPYRLGTRSRDWRKIKIVQRQEFVVGGWEPRAENREQVGSLLLGYYDPEQAGLQYAGRAGTGFDAGMHEKLSGLLAGREQKRSPFAGRVAGRGTRFVSPDLVAEIAYRRWPEGGDLQQASFLGLRDDVPARDVVIDREE